MDSIRVSIIQTDIVWENKQENLRLLHEKLQSLRGTTEIVYRKCSRQGSVCKARH